MDVIVLAGGIATPEEPLYVVESEKPKTLIPIAGKPMIQWVLDALAGSKKVEDILVVGLDSGSDLSFPRPLQFLNDHGSMLENLKAGGAYLLHQKPDIRQVLLVSGDLPAITPAIIDWRISISDEHSDIDYVVVEKEVMEKTFPASNRSYVHLKDKQICGGDINIVRLSSHLNDSFWQKMIAARKNPFKQAALIGFDTLLLLLTRMITLEQFEKKVCRRLNLRGKVHLSPYPEVAMDVDKPFQLDLLEAHLAEKL